MVVLVAFQDGQAAATPARIDAISGPLACILAVQKSKIAQVKESCETKERDYNEESSVLPSQGWEDTHTYPTDATWML